MDSNWMWLPEELVKFFNQSVLGPLRTAKSIFTNDNVFPVQRFVLLFGRPGVGKRTALEALCTQNNVSFSTLDGEDLYDGDSKIFLTKEHTSVEVLIVEHANSLIVGPYATTYTRNLALDLKKLAHLNKIFIFCLCDIVPKNMTQGDRDLVAVQFLHNFNATIFFKAPSANIRTEMFCKRVALLFDHFEEVAQRLNVECDYFCRDELSENDYKMLTDASHHCTPLQITLFMQRVALVIAQHPNNVLNTELIKECFYSKGPVDVSITEENTSQIESAFAADAGQSIPSGRAAEAHKKQQDELEQHVDYFVAEPDEEPSPKRIKKTNE